MPCRNERKYIESCLRDLLAQEPLPGGFEVLIVDGISDDGTRAILSRFTAQNQVFRVIDNPKRIASVGLNAAIREAKGQIIIRMDVHSEYASDYLRSCVETLRATGADNVGGPQRTKADGYIQEAVAAASHSPFSVGGARFHDVDYEGHVDTVLYGCWGKESFDRFGYFDEELVRNQDDEHNFRIVRNGGKIWQSPKIRSWYHPRCSLSGLFRQYLQYGYWKVRVIQKHRMAASVRHLVPGAFLASLCALGAAGSVWQPAWWMLGLLLLVYVFASFAASVHCALKNKGVLLPVLPVVFATYHLGYGIGFLCGVWDLGIGRKQPSAIFTSMAS